MYKKLINVLTLYIFSHRFNKQDKFLTELKDEVNAGGGYICFDDIRGVMYKYSKKKQRKFMANILLCFLMYNFLTSDAGSSFIEAKSVIKDEQESENFN